MSLWYVVHLNTYLDLVSYLEDSKIRFNCKYLTSVMAILANHDIYQAMFPTIMPWPMTLAPTNEAVRHENCAEKTLIPKI
jgi:hypothetical protein